MRFFLVALLASTTWVPLIAQDSRAPSSAWLARLPDGEAKRKFILDCTGCHQFDEKIARVSGRPRAETEWAEAVTRMLGYAGARTGFPIIAADRDPQSTAAWLSKYLGPGGVEAPKLPSQARAEITEFLMPEPSDLPHDIAIERSGTVLVTGMFTHRLYRLDPAAGHHRELLGRAEHHPGLAQRVDLDGRISEIAIPVANANPRAIETPSGGASMSAFIPTASRSMARGRSGSTATSLAHPSSSAA